MPLGLTDTREFFTRMTQESSDIDECERAGYALQRFGTASGPAGCPQSSAPMPGTTAPPGAIP